MRDNRKPTPAQLKFLLAIVRDGGTSTTCQTAVGSFRPINTCRDNGWASSRCLGSESDSRLVWTITGTGRMITREHDLDGYRDACAQHRQRRREEADLETLAAMNPEGLAERTGAVRGQLDKALAFADRQAGQPVEEDRPETGDVPPETLELLADVLRAAQVMAPAEVERSTGKLRYPGKCVDVPRELAEPRLGALRPEVLNALARREPTGGPVYALITSLRTGLVGPFGCPADVRRWWDVPYNRMVGHARLVVLQAL